MQVKEMNNATEKLTRVLCSCSGAHKCSVAMDIIKSCNSIISHHNKPKLPIHPTITNSIINISQHLEVKGWPGGHSPDIIVLSLAAYSNPLLLPPNISRQRSVVLNLGAFHCRLLFPLLQGLILRCCCPGYHLSLENETLFQLNTVII